MPAYKIPNIRLRDLQFDSFFIECIHNAPEDKRLLLEPNEAHWLYASDTWLHKFCNKATMDTKQAILAKLGFHFAWTVYDDKMGCDRSKWMETIAAARGSEDAHTWWEKYVNASSVFITGSYEIRNILVRLQVMYHSKLFPISRYIKRLRDYKRLGNYEALYKQQDFIYFMLKVCVSYTKFASAQAVFSLTDKEIVTLIYFYFEHRQLKLNEIKDMVGDLNIRQSLANCLEGLRKKGYIERTANPYNWKATNKNYTYMITQEGQDVIFKLCNKILQFV